MSRLRIGVVLCGIMFVFGSLPGSAQARIAPHDAAPNAPAAPQAGWEGYIWSDTFADGTGISSNTAHRVTDSVGGTFGESFTPYSGNPLSTIESSDPWHPGDQIPGAVHPDVQYFPSGIDGYTFWMIFTPLTFATTPPGGVTNDYYWERPTLVRSNDGINWVKTPDYSNPLVSPGPTGEWDSGWLADPDFVYAPGEGPNGEDWFLYWTGCGGGGCQIAMAMSEDGIHYTKYDDPNTPTSPYAFSDPVAPAYRCPAVIYDSDTGTFHMWYNWGSFDIGYATSTDGIDWTPYNPTNPGVWGHIVYAAHPGTYDQGGVTHEDVVFFGGQYHMYYMALPTAAYSSINIGHATSLDGITWTQSPNPVMTPGHEQWDFWNGPQDAMVLSFYRPSVAVVQDSLYLYYGGTNTALAYPATYYDLGLAFPSEPDGHIELTKATNPAEYPNRDNTAAWYHLNEGNPAPPSYPGPYPEVSDTLAWYHFNEGSGTTTADAAVGGIADTGTLIGPPTWNTGPSSAYGSALSYNNDDRVTVANSADLNPTEGITIEAWVNPSATKENNYVAIKQTVGGYDYAYGLKVNNGEIWAFIQNGGTLYWAHGGSVPQGSWSHIAMTYQLNPVSATTVSLYLNGSEVPSYTLQNSIPANTLIATNTGPLNIGVIPIASPVYYEGIIDELRIVGRALTPAEIAADGTKVSPTAAILDASGNSNTGTPNSGASWTTGRFDLGLQFDGTSGVATIPHATSLTLTDGITIEAWVNPSEVKSNNYILNKASPGIADFAYGLKLESQYTGSLEIGGIIGSTSSSNGLYFAYGGSVPISTWTHVAMTYQVGDSHIRLYQNGVEVAYRSGTFNQATDPIPAGAFIRTNTAPINIGMIPATSNHYYHGILDEIRILPYALTPEQIWVDYGMSYAQTGTLISELVTPPAGTQWVDFQAAHTLPAGTGIAYAVLDADSNVLIDPVVPGASLLSLGNTPIRLRATLTSSNPGFSPRLESWSLRAYNPTAVRVTAFQAIAAGVQTRLTWQTANEIDLFGFNLYGSTSPDGEKLQCNLSRIPAQYPGQLLGGDYEYWDSSEPGQTRYYWLELLTTTGSEWLGPRLVGREYQVMIPFLMH